MVKNNILVTGGFGLLGKPLVLKLINSNNNVSTKQGAVKEGATAELLLKETLVPST